jgi:flagellar motor protein MotB
MAETIGRQTASYRQGLVLGLTMAEIMLLLVFCLLIAVGVTLANQQAKLDAAVARLQTVERAFAADRAIVETIKRNPRLAQLVQRATVSGSQREIDEFWRKLIESNDIIVNMERNGLSRVALKEENDSLTKLARLLKGIDPDQIARSVALASAIDVAVKPEQKLKPQDIAALIEKGIAASRPGSDSDRQNRHNWPPIINLSEADGHYFATGSADLTPEFMMELRTVVVGKLLQIAAAYDVDVIEVIGHTDEQPISNRVSNLDRSLSLVTSGSNNAGLLQWADNAGLGLARALAVVKLLSSDPRLRVFRILPLSGAQLIDTDGRLTRWDGVSDVRERRRIEIRMRKSN